jgi:23S rRNA (cytosine1962-C5)-methyltransferase
MEMAEHTLQNILKRAFTARAPLMDAGHEGALRLYSGFYEGDPDLVIDLYGHTLVLFDFSKEDRKAVFMDVAQNVSLEHFPWIDCVLRKARFTEDKRRRQGIVTFGGPPATSILENGIRYAVDLTMNQDAGFYLDTRNLRAWLMEHSKGKQVLNTFAYTGSLGVAALAGGAARVVQTDRNQRFLSLARNSAMLNHLDLGRMKLRAADFFSEMGRYKREGELFDIAILDPPFFSVTESGTVDMLSESSRLINKLRPLVRDGGYLIVINNALFLSGTAFMAGLEALCSDGYLAVEETITVPEDICGFQLTRVAAGLTDPAPFNHSTKIVVMRVKRKNQMSNT